MADIPGIIRDAWTTAMAGASAAEQEAEKAFARVEASVDEALQKAKGKLGLPSAEDVAALTKRLDAVSERLAALEKERQTR